jgi:hypothetical protein
MTPRTKKMLELVASFEEYAEDCIAEACHKLDMARSIITFSEESERMKTSSTQIAETSLRLAVRRKAALQELREFIVDSAKG